MKFFFFSPLSLLLALLTSCSNGQTKPAFLSYTKDTFELARKNVHSDAKDTFEFTYKNAHPNAKVLMSEDFYWSAIEETAPFGNDDGFDAAYGFRNWRHSNKAAKPRVYLDEVIASWGYPYFDYREMDSIKIKAYISSQNPLSEEEMQQRVIQFKELLRDSPDTASRHMTDQQLRGVILSASVGMGAIYLVGQDNAIIAIAFAQFVLEGAIDEEMRSLAIIAIDRQILPVLLNRYDPRFKARRKEQLTRMLAVLNGVGSID